MASLQLGCFELIKNFVFSGFIRNTFNRVFCYRLKYSNNYSYLKAVSPVLILLLPLNFFQKCDILLGGLRFVTVCDWGGGSKIIKNSVTYFMDGPQVIDV